MFSFYRPQLSILVHFNKGHFSPSSWLFRNACQNFSSNLRSLQPLSMQHLDALHKPFATIALPHLFPSNSQNIQLPLCATVWVLMTHFPSESGLALVQELGELHCFPPLNAKTAHVSLSYTSCVQLTLLKCLSALKQHTWCANTQDENPMQILHIV